MSVIEAFKEALEVEVAARQIRGRRQAVEVIDVERDGVVRTQQRVVGVPPCAALVTLTSVFKRIHRPIFGSLARFR